MVSDDEDEQQAGDDHAGPTSSADEAEFVAEEAPQTNWAVHDVARLPDGGFAIVTHVEAADVRLERCTGMAAFAFKYSAARAPPVGEAFRQAKSDLVQCIAQHQKQCRQCRAHWRKQDEKCPKCRSERAVTEPLSAKSLLGWRLEAFMASDETQLLLPPEPHGLNNWERNLVHDFSRELDPSNAMSLRTESKGEPGKNRQLVISKLATWSASAAGPSTAGPQPDLAGLAFADVVNLLQELESTEIQSMKQRKELVYLFFRRGARHGGTNLFTLLRLLLPFDDTRRYFLSQSRLAKYACLALGLSEHSVQERIDRWHDEWGDLALAIEAEWRERVGTVAAPLTVGDANDGLEQLAHRKEARKTIARLLGRCSALEAKWLIRIIQRDLGIGRRPNNPVPFKGEWPKIVFDGLDKAQGRTGTPRSGNPPLSYSLFRHQHNLYHVANDIQHKRLRSTYPPPLMLGRHCRAQLSSPCMDLDRIEGTLGTTDVFVETKLDGFRLQVHWRRDSGDGELLKCFWRSGIDCTSDVADLLPALRLAFGSEQQLWPLNDGRTHDFGDARLLQAEEADAPGDARADRYTWLRKAAGEARQGRADARWQEGGLASLGGPRPRSVVLDGELLVYDEVGTAAGTYDELGNAPGIVGFGTIHWVKCGGYGKAPSNYSRADCRRHLFFKAFDVLHLDGVDVMHRPLAERRRILEERCFVDVPRYVERTSCRRYDLRLQPRAVHDAFAWAQSRGEEGLMVKSAAQPYVPCARSHTLKLKPEYVAGLGDVTLLVVGARFVDGPRRKVIVDGAPVAPQLAEFALAAPRGDGSGKLVYLFYSSTLSWKGPHGGLLPLDLERLHRDLKEGDAHTDPLMHRVRRDEPCPPWLEYADAAIGPRAAERWRMDFVLDDPAEAPVVEVLGARFLRASATGAGAGADGVSKAANFTLRDPRLKRRVGSYGDASVSASVDTLASFVAKAKEAIAPPTAAAAAAELPAAIAPPPAPEPPAPAVGSTRPRSPGAEAAAAALRAFGAKQLKKEIKERGLQERSEGMVEKAELVALLLEDGWRPPQEDSDDETDDEERTRLC